MFDISLIKGKTMASCRLEDYDFVSLSKAMFPKMAGALHSQRGLRVAKIAEDVLGEFTIQASKAELAATRGV